MTIKVLGIDIAKNTFQLHGVDAVGSGSEKATIAKQAGDLYCQFATMYHCDGVLQWRQLLGKSFPEKRAYREVD